MNSGKICKNAEFSLFILVALFFVCCKSTPKSSLILDYSPEEPAAEDTRYVFFRLYNPIYKNPFEVSNVLKNAISLIETNPIKASHSAIGFDLDDGFYGLTLAGDKAFKYEECNNTSSNVYMKKCNDITSVQTTFALSVSTEEYNNIKLLVDYYYNDAELRYASEQNFGMAIYFIKRKFFLPGDENSIGSDRLAKKDFDEADYFFNPEKEDFVCSNLIAYILYTTVEPIHEFIVDNQVNLMNISPSDIAVLPGVKRLFSSSWADCDTAARNFVAEHKEFSKYMTPAKIARTK